MALNRPFADAQHLTDPIIGVSLRDVPQNLRLAFVRGVWLASRQLRLRAIRHWRSPAGALRFALLLPQEPGLP